MVAYVLRRIALLAPLLLGVAVVVFALVHIMPGDPAAVLLGQDATPEAVAELRATLGLDRPLPVQLGRYLANLAQGDLGQSIFQGETVAAAIAARLPATLELAAASLAVAIVLGVGLGVVSAVKKGTAIDTGAMIFGQLGVSVPVFWLGILLMFWFAVQLNWLPAVGRGESIGSATLALLSGRPSAFLDSLRHLALPALALGAGSAAILSRMVRTAMLETLNADFVRTATAKGLARYRIVVRHALRNALLPVVNVAGLRLGELLGGAVLTESIFGWPGLGQLAVTAISQRDMPVVQGVVLIFALMFALLNLAVDTASAGLDPRVRPQT